MIGRHADEATVASHRRRIRAIAITDGAVLFAGVVALTVTLAVDNAPSVQADELPQPPEMSEPATPVAGPVQPIFDFADVTPWDPGKEPGLVVGSVSAERPRTTSRVVAAQEAADGPQVAGPVPVDPPNGSEGSQPVPPKDDPLHDDGEFGDGCEQPGTRPRCDPVVGLPPVVVPPVDEAEQPPIEEPAEEETPVDEVEVVEPTEEVAP